MAKAKSSTGRRISWRQPWHSPSASTAARNEARQGALHHAAASCDPELAQHGYDETPEIQAAALLHYAVEDTPTLVGDILDAFGPHVAELVYWLTDAEEGKRKHRKLMSAWRLSRAPLKTKLIKLADLIDNSEDIVRNHPDFAPRYLAEKRLIIAQMADVEGETITKLAIYREAVIPGQRR